MAKKGSGTSSSTRISATLHNPGQILKTADLWRGRTSPCARRSVNQGLGTSSETEDLRMPMGDIRNGDTDGLWAPLTPQDAHGSFGNGFEQDTYGIHLARTMSLRPEKTPLGLFGGAFHYGQSYMDGTADERAALPTSTSTRSRPMPPTNRRRLCRLRRSMPGTTTRNSRARPIAR